jgi:hypothetical protein
MYAWLKSMAVLSVNRRLLVYTDCPISGGKTIIAQVKMFLLLSVPKGQTEMFCDVIGKAKLMRSLLCNDISPSRPKSQVTIGAIFAILQFIINHIYIIYMYVTLKIYLHTKIFLIQKIFFLKK